MADGAHGPLLMYSRYTAEHLEHDGNRAPHSAITEVVNSATAGTERSEDDMNTAG